MVYLDYTTLDFYVNGNNDVVIYTVPYKCIIMCETLTRRGTNSSFSAPRVFVRDADYDTGTGDLERDIYLMKTEDAITQTGSHIARSGSVVIANGRDVQFSGRLHIFRLPESV